MMRDVYETFAYDYDEFGPIEAYLGEEKDFFARLFSAHGVRTVWDCACGTGQHLAMFAGLGYRVWGSDSSLSMLEVASGNLEKLGVTAPLCQCDFRRLESRFDTCFDAVVCLTSALPHLHTDEDLLTAIRSIKNRLNRDGLVIFTSGTTDYTLDLPPVEVVVEREDFTRVFFKEHDNRFQTIRVLDLFHRPGRLEHRQHDIVYRILLDGDYRRLLTQAGFSQVNLYGDYGMHPYDQNSRRLIAVARV